MTVGFIRCFVLGAGLAIPLAVPSRVEARTELRCGVGLVAGMASCIDWKMKASEYRRLKARALKGDREASATLAFFEDAREDRVADNRDGQWRRLAAEQGDCDAIRILRDEALEKRQRATAVRWQTRIRWNGCAASHPWPEVFSRSRK